MTDKIKIEVTADTTKAVAGLNAVTGATKKADDAAKGAGDTFSSTFSESASKITGWATAVLGAGAALTALYAAGSVQADAATRLGAAYDGVAAATNGVVTAQQALRVQQTFVQSGLQITNEQLAVVTRAAREYGLATGTELSASLDQMTDALRTNSAEGLARYNINVGAGVNPTRNLADAISQLTISHETAGLARKRDIATLAESEGAQGRVTHATAKLTRAANDLTVAQNDSTRAHTALTTALASPVPRTFTEDLARMPGLAASAVVTVVNATASMVGAAWSWYSSQIAPGAGSFGDSLVELGRAGVDFVSGTPVANTGSPEAGRRALEARMRRSGVQLNVGNSAMDLSQLTMAERQRVTRSMAASPGMESLGVNRTLEGISRDRDSAATAAAAAAATAAAAAAAQRADDDKAMTAASRRAKGYVEGTSAVLDAFHRALARSIRRLDALATRGFGRTLSALTQIPAPGRDEFDDMLGQLAGPSDADLAGEGAGRTKAEANFALSREAARIDRDRNQRRANRDRNVRRTARTESLGGRVIAGLGFDTNDEGQINPFNAAIEGASMLSSAVGTLQTGLSTMFNTMASGSADAATAFQTFATSVLGDLGKMAMEKGVFFLFEGIAAAVSNPIAAPGLLLAGGGLMALGAGLGAVSASAGAQAAPTPPSPNTLRGLAPRSASLSTGGPPGGVTVVMSSLVPAGPVDAQRMRDGDRTRMRQGFGDRVPRRVEY